MMNKQGNNIWWKNYVKEILGKKKEKKRSTDINKK